MRIDTIIIPAAIEEKLDWKHNVQPHEARSVLFNRPRIRFVENGHVEGDNVYLAAGQTIGGRYLSIFFIYKPINHTAIISARNMSGKERKQYGRK